MIWKIYPQQDSESQTPLTDALWPVKECTRLPSAAFQTHILQSAKYAIITHKKGKQFITTQLKSAQHEEHISVL